jgi:hypothetical protein
MLPPRPSLSMACAAYLQNQNGARTFVRSMASQSSFVVSSSPFSICMPALFTTKSIAWNCSSTFSMARRTAVSSQTSAGMASTVPSRPSANRAVSASVSAFRLSASTLAPSAARASTVARPRPPEAPVTTPDFPRQVGMAVSVIDGWTSTICSPNELTMAGTTNTLQCTHCAGLH